MAYITNFIGKILLVHLFVTPLTDFNTNPPTTLK